MRPHNIEIKSWIPARPFTKHGSITSGGREVVYRDVSLQPPVQTAQKIVIRKRENGKEPTVKEKSLIILFKSLLLYKLEQGKGDFIFTKNILIYDTIDFI